MYRLISAIVLGCLAPTAWTKDNTVAAAAYTYLEARGDSSRPALRIFSSDLNDDGWSDAIVLLTGDLWCGSGGCSMLIFKGSSKGFSFVSSSTLTQEPVAVLTQKQYGWHTLVVMSGGVGKVLMKFSGKKYPSNPSLQPKAPAALIQQVQVPPKQLVTSE